MKCPPNARETMFYQNLEAFQKLKPEPDFIGYDTEEHLQISAFSRILTSKEIIPLGTDTGKFIVTRNQCSSNSKQLNKKGITNPSVNRGCNLKVSKILHKGNNSSVDDSIRWNLK